jgi:hypothetical protein
MTEDEILFWQKLPQLPLDTTLRLFEEHGDMVSMGGRPAALSHLLVAFVSRKGDLVGPLMLNSTVARELCKLLIENGHGPERESQAQ